MIQAYASIALLTAQAAAFQRLSSCDPPSVDTRSSGKR
jgi:hypothetical protein